MLLIGPASLLGGGALSYLIMETPACWTCAEQNARRVYVLCESRVPSFSEAWMLTIDKRRERDEKGRERRNQGKRSG